MESSWPSFDIADLDDAGFDILDEELPEWLPVERPRGSGFEMRDYQGSCVVAVQKGWAEVVRQLVVMATGCGKTVVFCELARMVAQAGGRTLVLAHTDELVDQAIGKMRRAGVGAGKEKAGSYASAHDAVVCASVQTMCRADRLESWRRDHFAMVVVDEAHRVAAASYQKIVAHFCGGGEDRVGPRARLLGVTATPMRADNKSMGEYFDRVAFDYPLIAPVGRPSAVRDGWLVKPIVRTIKLPPIDLRVDPATGENIRVVKGDLDAKQVGHAIEPFLEAIAQAIWAEASERKVLIFLPSVETAAKMAACLRRAGFATADFVSGACTDRNEKVRAYKRGEIQALCNCALLTEGFDHDAIDCVVVLRATQLRGLYEQCIGRGTRPLTEIVPALNAASDAAERRAIIAASRKPHLLILDPLWLYEKHDLMSPAQLVTDDPAVAKRMQGKEGDLLALEEKAERDVLKALKKAVERNKNREARTIDLEALAESLHDASVADYEPKTLWECGDPTPGQIEQLRKLGFPAGQVRTKGHASKLISTFLARRKMGRSSPRQILWLKRYGIDATGLTYKAAHEEMATIINAFQKERK